MTDVKEENNTVSPSTSENDIQTMEDTDLEDKLNCSFGAYLFTCQRTIRSIWLI